MRVSNCLWSFEVYKWIMLSTKWPKTLSQDFKSEGMDNESIFWLKRSHETISQKPKTPMKSTFFNVLQVPSVYFIMQNGKISNLFFRIVLLDYPTLLFSSITRHLTMPGMAVTYELLSHVFDCNRLIHRSWTRRVSKKCFRIWKATFKWHLAATFTGRTCDHGT